MFTSGDSPRSEQESIVEHRETLASGIRLRGSGDEEPMPEGSFRAEPIGHVGETRIAA